LIIHFLRNHDRFIERRAARQGRGMLQAPPQRPIPARYLWMSSLKNLKFDLESSYVEGNALYCII
jgi:hypothetical protein